MSCSVILHFWSQHRAWEWCRKYTGGLHRNGLWRNETQTVVLRCNFSHVCFACVYSVLVLCTTNLWMGREQCPYPCVRAERFHACAVSTLGVWIQQTSTIRPSECRLESSCSSQLSWQFFFWPVWVTDWVFTVGSGVCPQWTCAALLDYRAIGR